LRHNGSSTSHRGIAIAFSEPLEAQDASLVPARFEVRDHFSGGRHTLILSGELDLAHAETLETMLVMLCVEGVAAISLDLTALTFIDSTGIRALVRAQQLCEEHGYEYLLTPGNATVQRIFEVTGLLDALPFERPSP